MLVVLTIFGINTPSMLACGVDHIRHKHAKGPDVSLDLASHEHQEILLAWISSGAVAAVAIAPPCGTASRAREIPQHGGPQPLRSHEQRSRRPSTSLRTATRKGA